MIPVHNALICPLSGVEHVVDPGKHVECSHCHKILCEDCAQEVVSAGEKCPRCSKPLTFSSEVNFDWLDALINLEIMCQVCEDTVLTHVELGPHCRELHLPCPDNCGEQLSLSRRELQEHLENDCPAQNVNCIKCRMTFPRSHSNDHSCLQGFTGRFEGIESYLCEFR